MRVAELESVTSQSTVMVSNNVYNLVVIEFIDSIHFVLDCTTNDRLNNL